MNEVSSYQASEIGLAISSNNQFCITLFMNGRVFSYCFQDNDEIKRFMGMFSEKLAEFYFKSKPFNDVEIKQ